MWRGLCSLFFLPTSRFAIMRTQNNPTPPVLLFSFRKCSTAVSSSRLRSSKRFLSPPHTPMQTSIAPLQQPARASRPCRETRRQETSELNVAALTGFQPARDVLCMICEDYFRARSLDAGKNLEHDALFVQPTTLRRRFHHGIFAAHVVGRHRNVEFVQHSLDDV